MKIDKLWFTVTKRNRLRLDAHIWIEPGHLLIYSDVRNLNMLPYLS